jgi:hypothetical protein
MALGVSLAVHAAAAAGLLGTAVWRGWQFSKRVDIELVSMKVKEIEELPLGAPPVTKPAGEAPARRRPRPKVAAAGDGVKLAATDGGVVAEADAPNDAGVTDAGDARVSGGDAAVPRPKDLRAYGPEGSRLTALLRLDRLRASPHAEATIAAVDQLLVHLPDRRRLLDGTGLDLFRDFDALLVATPNPLDDAVTFLAARHRLSDDEFMSALERGAVAAGRPIVWQKGSERPVGIRRARAPGSAEGSPPVDRDARILVLPQPGLAVMAPPAYARLLLPEAERQDGAGAAGAGEAPARDPGAAARWGQLVARIDAEDGAMPEEAVLMMTAANLLERRGGRAGSPTGAAAETPPAPALAGPGGLALPAVLSAIVGTTPTPFVELTAEFEKVADTEAWQQQWPGFRQKLLGNPLVLLGGIMPIVTRAELSRDGSTLILRTSATHEEMRRILGMVGNLLGGAGRR